MADLNVLASYMVSLGFAVDQPQLRKFDLALKDGAKAVEMSTAGIAKELLKWQGAITTAFTSVSAAVVGMADHVAMADQGFRLLGLKMFLTTEQARKLQTGLDALGASLSEISWDPELRERFLELSDLQDRLARNLGPDFEHNMRAIRDLRFEFVKLKIEMQYGVMRFASSLFRSLGTNIDEVSSKLRQWEEWFVQNMPAIADFFSKQLAPVLKDTWQILQLVGTGLGEFATTWSNLIGLLSGDRSIQSTEFSFERLAGAIQHVAWLAGRRSSVDRKR